MRKKTNDLKIKALDKWREEMKNNLSKNQAKTLDLYIVNKNWVEKFQEFSKKSKFGKFELINNQVLFFPNDDENIDPNKDFCVMNKECWKNFQTNESGIETDCEYCNKKLIVNLGKDYYFYYLDLNNNIQEGYFRITEKEPNKINKILKEFKNY